VQHGPVTGEKEAVIGASREILHLGVSLATVQFKPDRNAVLATAVDWRGLSFRRDEKEGDNTMTKQNQISHLGPDKLQSLHSVRAFQYGDGKY
jgi:hypothetical protein